MNSFNHYAYGAIGDWLYRVVAGIEIGKPGYKQIVIQPHPDRRLSFATAIYNSAYGEIRSGWKFEGDVLVVNATIPANTSAVIRLPETKIAEVRSEGKSIQGNDMFKGGKEEGGSVVFEVGSGSYEWRFTLER
jgi:alpha-L-rhamnosidase